MKKNGKSVINSSLRVRAIEHLALSLHCLQDTFSPAHTDRTTSSNANKPGKIRNISIYEFQNKHDHGTKDYKSGSTNSNFGTSAINASTVLMLLCVQAVSQNSYLLRGWDNFQAQWLSFDPYIK